MPYTVQFAEKRIPLVLKRIALMAIDTIIVLDVAPLRSQDVEDRLMALQGYMAHLWKCYIAVCKAPKKKVEPSEDV